MLKSLAARLVIVSLVFVVAAFALMAPPIGSARTDEPPPYTLPDWMTPADQLPEKFRPVLECAETGDPECQDDMADIWDSMYDGETHNWIEAKRWAGSAARLGHPDAWSSYVSLLCDSFVALGTSDAQIVEDAIEAYAWITFIESEPMSVYYSAHSKIYLELPRTSLERCSVIDEVTGRGLIAKDTLAAKGEARAEALLAEVPRHWPRD